MGADIFQREEVAKLLAASAVFTTWSGIADAAERQLRIVSPELSGEELLPAIVLTSGSSRRQLFPGGAISGFKASGEILLKLFDGVNLANSIAVEERRFADLFTGVIDDLVESEAMARQETPVRISEVHLPWPAWHRTDLMTEDDSDEDLAEAAEGEERFSGSVWIGRAVIRWGYFD